MKLWQSDLFQGVAFGEVAEEIRLTHQLSQKAARFVFEYPKDNNGTQAAVRAGFSAKTAAQQASRLLKNVKVQKAIAGLVERVHKKCEVTVERIRYEAACIAFFNPKDLLDENGNVRAFKDLPDDVARAVASLDVDEIRVGLLKVGEAKKVRLWSKTEALKLLGQEKKMWAPEEGAAQAGRFILVTSAAPAAAPAAGGR